MSLMDPGNYQRIARWLHLHGVPVLPWLISRLIRFVFGAWIPHTADIGRGTTFGYGGLGVVVHSQAVIGQRVEVGSGVVIGGSGTGPGVPRIEDDVYIGCGAKVLGPVTVGTGSIIGANAVVIHDVPAHCVVGGIPARIIRENINADEFLHHRRVRRPE